MCIWQNEAKIMKLIKGKPLNDSWCAEAIPALLEKGIERKSDARVEIREVARRAAEAQIDLGRVRST
jgi:hypothetical protein